MKAKKTKPVAPTKDIRTDAAGIAHALGLSAARVHQMKREGLLKAGDDGKFSIVESLRAHFWYDSPKGENLRARTAALEAATARHSMRAKQELRQLVTVEEAARIGFDLFEVMTLHRQRSTQAIYLALAGVVGAAKAKEITHGIDLDLNGRCRQFQAGWRECMEIIRKGLGNGQRIDTIYKHLSGLGGPLRVEGDPDA